MQTAHSSTWQKSEQISGRVTWYKGITDMPQYDTEHSNDSNTHCRARIRNIRSGGRRASGTLTAQQQHTQTIRSFKQPMTSLLVSANQTHESPLGD